MFWDTGGGGEGGPGDMVRCRPRERGRLPLGEEGEGGGHGDKVQADGTGSPHGGLRLACPGGSRPLSCWENHSPDPCGICPEMSGNRYPVPLVRAPAGDFLPSEGPLELPSFCHRCLLIGKIVWPFTRSSYI